MLEQTKAIQTGRRLQPPRLRRGITLIELVVAATLLVGVMSFVAPLAVRSGRLWQDSRHYRLALDELSNQLERLTSLNENERTAALAELSVSPQVRTRLPNPVLKAHSINDTDGARLVLQIQWDRVGPAKPVTLVAWIDPLPIDTEKNTEKNLEAENAEATAEEIEQ